MTRDRLAGTGVDVKGSTILLASLPDGPAAGDRDSLAATLGVITPAW